MKVGAVVSMACGGREKHLARIASGATSRLRNKYGGKSFAEWFAAQNFPPEKARKIASQRYRYARSAGTTQAETLEAWCAEVGIPVPPTPGAVMGPKERKDGDSLPTQVRAAAREAPWVAWLLLIAGKQIPENPNELNFRLELYQ